MKTIALPCLVFVALLHGSCTASGLEEGAAITDATVLEILDQGKFSAARLLMPQLTDAWPVPNSNLFQGALNPMLRILEADIESLPQGSLDATAREVFAQPESSRFRFSTNLLNDVRSRFVLTGIINRMDRAYRTVDGVRKISVCGEIRFIYRFTYDVKVAGNEVASRLPFTMSVVLNARNRDVTSISCAEIARRWQALERVHSSTEMLTFLQSKKSPIDYLQPSQVDRVEVNLQLFRVPAGIETAFGGYAEYLMRVFKREGPGKPFLATRLENQIDRQLLFASVQDRNAFKHWLLRAKNIRSLDEGTIDIPFRFLATRAISVSPGGLSRSQNRQDTGLLEDDEIQNALRSASAHGTRLVRIKSVEGFRRRLEDVNVG